MLRKFLTIALPLLLPFLLYGVYVTLARRRAGAGAQARWRDAPWVWITAAGVALMAASIAVFGVTAGVEPGTRLAPPTMVDGEVVPSHPVED